jgi:hypothetical protein
VAAGTKYVNMGSKPLTDYWNSSTKVIPSGLYYSSSAPKVEIPAGAVSAPGGVTIVTPREVVFSDGARLKPYYQDLTIAAYWNEGSGNCDYKGVDVPGKNNQIEGIIYAPNSLIAYQGDNNVSVGAWIARAFYISGTGNKITALPAPPTTTTTDPTVKLLK